VLFFDGFLLYFGFNKQLKQIYIDNPSFSFDFSLLVIEGLILIDSLP
jgi:hypothetical protein